jgi:hypothetical protein
MRIHNIWTSIIAGLLMVIFIMLSLSSTITVHTSKMYLQNKIEDSRLQTGFEKR